MRAPIVLAALAILSVHSPGVTAPRVDKGKLLVATHQLDDSPYKHAVILVTENGEKGAYGLAINHPTPVFIEEFLPDTTLRQSPANRLYLGGSNAVQLLFVVTHASKVARVNHLAGDLYFAAGRDAATILTHSPENTADVRAYAGYLNWPAGEIDRAIADGDWKVVDAQTEWVFNKDPSTLWEQLTGAWDGQWM